MYCPRCGTEASEGSAYCTNCGAPLTDARPAATAQPATALQASPQGPQQDRSPLMAAILNLFFGLGYVYMGYHKVMGVQVAVFVVLMVIVYFVAGIVTDGLASLVISIILAVDGHQKASGLRGYIGAG